MAPSPDSIRAARLKTFGVETNWAILDLSDRNTVLIDVIGEGRHDTGESPSEWIGLDHLMPLEIATLRRGLTWDGRDRARPQRNGR